MKPDPDTTPAATALRRPRGYTTGVSQHDQEIVLRYAHRPPTTDDIAHMVEMLRGLADQLAAEGQP